MSRCEDDRGKVKYKKGDFFFSFESQPIKSVSSDSGLDVAKVVQEDREVHE